MSQNAKQLAEGGNYSYTKYDSLGRITEVGQIDGGGSMSDSLSRTPDQLQGWLAGNAGSREQITTTVYDLPSKDIPGGKDISAYMQQPQGNTRGRVSFTTFTQGNNPANYDQATYYSYDAHGNVQHLLQDYGSSSVMGVNGHQYKRVDYDYDLVSSKVNKVSYQSGRPDAFYHLYKYDAENRITDVYTSKDSLLWDHEAWYQYYKHGPLARTEIGANRVQGITYAYTLQGWLKSINPVEGDTNDASIMPRPAYNVRLNYYDGDYQAIDLRVTPAGVAGQLGNLYRPLYNGNINSMAVNIGKLQNPLLYGYQYDQLNRLSQMDAWQGQDSSFRSLSLLDKYHEGITYDANGNIDRYQRKGNNPSAIVMDQLSYHYQPSTNKLNYIEDAIPDNAYPNDIDNQQPGNYSYDAIGNLVSDAKEGINNIRWTVYGKIAGITKADGTSISYGYDAGGHRISKIVNGRTDWYVRDASGNVLTVYTVNDNSINGGHFTQKELSLYGSSRLGILNLQKDLTAGAPTSYNLGTVLQADSSSSLLRGRKLFELGNHLGNVLATVSDKVIPHSSNDSTVDSYSADVVSAQDYYPFGMLMPGRSYSSATPYRYGFNGKENDNEVKGEGNQQDYGMRVYDPRAGRFLSVDPLQKQYPELTPYQFASNSPIANIDLDGLEQYHYARTLDKQGKTVLTFLRKSDFYETKWDPGFDGGFHLWTTAKNPRTEYVVHQTDNFIYYPGNGSTKNIPYDESVTYSSLEAAGNASDKDFEGTKQDFIWGAVGAASVVAQNERDGTTSTNRIIKKGGEAPSANEQATSAHGGNTEAAEANSAAPNEAYNRQKHYGKTPTNADRKALNATPNDVVDHKTPLVKHYYEGDGEGGKPGYAMTDKERKSFAKDRRKMQLQTKKESNQQGAKMSQYSKEKKKEHNL